MNQVELIYNPYKEQSRILVNGHSVSEYSQLANYLREPFEVWEPIILECIEQELNDDFSLKIQAETIHYRLLRELAEQCPSCVSIEKAEFSLHEPALVRLEKERNLERKLKSNNELEDKVRIFIFSESSLIGDSVFGSFCKNYGCKIEDGHLTDEKGMFEIVITTEPKKAEETEYQLVITINEERSTEKTGRLCVTGKEETRYAEIMLSESQHYAKIENGIFSFGIGFDGLVALLWEMVEGIAAAPYIKRKRAELDTLDLETLECSEEEELDFKLVDSIEPITVAFCKIEMEVGESAAIKVETVPETDIQPDLEVKIGNPAILEQRGGALYGISDGETDVEIKVKGSVEPIFRKTIRVKRVIRISEIQFLKQNIVLRPGIDYKIEYVCIPEDADNIEELMWRSSNCEIAEVENGVIHTYKAGICDITAYAGNVEKTCHIQVKPEMSRIVVPDGLLTLTIGKEVSFFPSCEPSDCFDTRIFWKVENPEVVKYDGRKITACGLGETEIRFSDERRCVKAAIPIKVESTLYASEKPNYWKLASFLAAAVSLLLLTVSKAFVLIATIVGSIFGCLAVAKDYSNVEGMVNVNGEPMKPDCIVSILFLGVNIVIGILVLV